MNEPNKHKRVVAARRSAGLRMTLSVAGGNMGFQSSKTGTCTRRYSSGLSMHMLRLIGGRKEPLRLTHKSLRGHNGC